MSGFGMGRVGSDRERLAKDLSTLGLPSGGDVLVHSSLRRVGLGVDSPAILLAALRDVLGDGATVVVPTQTALNSTTSPEFRRATHGMTEDQVALVEATIEGFDRDVTPSHGMGALAEYVRRCPGTVRSGHPQASFAALGPRAAELMAVHELDCHLGDRSPLGALYRGYGSVMLLGVGYEACTALHLAEYWLPGPPATRWYRCYTMEQGDRVRHDFLAPDLDASDFALLGAAMDREPFVATGTVGDAVARVMPVRAAVDFAIGWLSHHRQAADRDTPSASAHLR